MSRRPAAIAVVLVFLSVACTQAPDLAITDAPAGSGSQAATVATPRPPVACPSSIGSPVATSPFVEDVFLHDESRGIARAWLAGLTRLYAGDPTMDPCTIFTQRGLEAARAADPRLRDALDRERTIVARLDLQVAFEGVYDLRRAPVTVLLDVIFDIAGGAVETDLPAATRTVSIDAQRAGFGVTFLFDGSTWRADDVGTVSAENTMWSTMPTPVPPGDPCAGMRLDPAGAAFDDLAATPFEVQGDDPRSGRAWCDAQGSGRVIRQPDQLVLLTRYPCGRGTVAMLGIGNPAGAPLDPLNRYEYLRDPKREAFDAGWIDTRWRRDASLPADAASTGWTNGNIELWISPSRLERGVYIRLGDAFEWWPRASPDGWGVMDCN